METILIDEKEMKDSFVKEARAINSSLRGAMQQKQTELGIGLFVGGLEVIMCSENDTLEGNIKNLFASFESNFAESIFFQMETIKKTKMLSIVQDYLNKKGLLDDFLKYREQEEVKNKRIGN